MTKGKLFSKISLIDLIVIVFLALVAAVLIFRTWFYPTAQTTDPTPPVTQETPVTDGQQVQCVLTLQFQRVTGTLLSDPMAEGEIMYYDETEIGSIQKITREISTISYVKDSGEVITAEWDAAYNYNVEVTATLYRHDGALRLADGTPVALGQSISIDTHYFSASGLVTSVKKIQ